MKCENCPANQNIYGTYEMPQYGCALFDESETRENKNGEEYCLHRYSTIEKMLKEQLDEPMHF